MPASHAPMATARIWSADQSWNYQREFRAPTGQVMRVTIRRNAYDAQSHGVVEGFDPAAMRWSKLHQLPVEALSCRPISYTDRTLTPAKERLFEQDAEKLLTVPLAVLAQALKA